MNINSEESRLCGLWRGKCDDVGVFAGEWVTGLFLRRWDSFWGRWAAYILRLDDLGKITGEFRVAPQTVGACVGFCDIDKTPIFDGDILKTGKNTYAVVTWNSGIASFVLPIGDDTYTNLRAIDVWENKIKVVGNIHDNPELLKEDEEDEPFMVDFNLWMSEMKKMGISEETIAALESLALRLREESKSK